VAGRRGVLRSVCDMFFLLGYRLDRDDPDLLPVSAGTISSLLTNRYERRVSPPLITNQVVFMMARLMSKPIYHTH
jgi:hypothetical protein